MSLQDGVTEARICALERSHATEYVSAGRSDVIRYTPTVPDYETVTPRGWTSSPIADPGRIPEPSTPDTLEYIDIYNQEAHLGMHSPANLSPNLMDALQHMYVDAPAHIEFPIANGECPHFAPDRVCTPLPQARPAAMGPAAGPSGVKHGPSQVISIEQLSDCSKHTAVTPEVALNVPVLRR